MTGVRDMKRAARLASRVRGSQQAVLTCPFCGSTPVVETCEGLTTSVYKRVRCQNLVCAIRPETLGHRTEWEAVNTWNTRAPSSEQGAS